MKKLFLTLFILFPFSAFASFPPEAQTTIVNTKTMGNTTLLSAGTRTILQVCMSGNGNTGSMLKIGALDVIEPNTGNGMYCGEMNNTSGSAVTLFNSATASTTAWVTYVNYNTNTTASSTQVRIVNFPATQAVTGTFWQTTQPVSLASVPSHTVTVSNFPATQPVSGTVAVSNFPATQPVSGTVAVSNFPASQAVTGTFWQTTQPVTIIGTSTVNIASSTNLFNFPTTTATTTGGYTGLNRAEMLFIVAVFLFLFSLGTWRHFSVVKRKIITPPKL